MDGNDTTAGHVRVAGVANFWKRGTSAHAHDTARSAVCIACARALYLFARLERVLNRRVQTISTLVPPARAAHQSTRRSVRQLNRRLQRVSFGA